jgi:phage gp29-like protein
MNHALLRYVDAVVDDSAGPAAKALQPLTEAVQRAIESADEYEDADRALARLEGSLRAEGLEAVLEGAMMNGTSAGGVVE